MRKADLSAGVFLCILFLVMGGERRVSAQVGDLTLADLGEEGTFSKKLPNTPEAREAGKAIYIKRCLPCHGVKGDGNGPVADTLNPRPRDFTRGLFKIRTTAWQEAPTEEDHFRTVSRGIPGTAMPAFREILTEEERWQVLYFERTFFSEKFPSDHRPKEITLSREPAMTPESVAKGKELFQTKLPCWACHGREGRGDGPLALGLKDDWGNPILPRNLTKSWQYKGGGRTKDIFLRISTGLNGTPMSASFAEKLTDEERWHVAHYVTSLQKDPQLGEVIVRSLVVSSGIPLDPEDPLWVKAPPLDIPLAGQVHVPLRNENPSVDLVTARSLHNNTEIGFLLEWDDRTKNTRHEAQEEAPQAAAQDVKEEKSPHPTYPVLYPPTKENRFTSEVLRDSVALQFPVKLPVSSEKPHFLLGDTGKPVNLWQWKADWNEDPGRPTPVEEQNATGYKTPVKVQPPESQQVQGKGVFTNGRWRVVMKRSLTTQDTRQDIQFEGGRLIPIAFHVWDGHNGETGLRRSISSWFFVLREVPTPPRAYILAILAVFLAGGLEVWWIRRLRTREKI